MVRGTGEMIELYLSECPTTGCMDCKLKANRRYN